MDRDDLRFVADALASRIAGDRDELERLAATDLMRLSALSTALSRNAAGAIPVLAAAAELMAICRHAGAVCDVPAAPDLKIVVDSLLKLAAEPPAPRPNRASRRARAAALPRAERRGLILPRSGLVH